MDEQVKPGVNAGRPVLTILTSHWLSVAGAALVTVAACTWFLLLVTKLGARETNPYVGILIFMVILINKRELMGDWVNPRWFNLASWATVVIMIGLTLALVGITIRGGAS